jgi:hypothetical protein
MFHKRKSNVVLMSQSGQHVARIELLIIDISVGVEI